MTLDGVPLNDPFGGWVIWSQAAPEMLERVDIVRGAGAGPYGAGALTGTIALSERDRGGVLDASVIERGGARLAGSGSTMLGPVGVTLSGLYETSNGYTPVRGSAAGRRTRRWTWIVAARPAGRCAAGWAAPARRDPVSACLHLGGGSRIGSAEHPRQRQRPQPQRHSRQGA